MRKIAGAAVAACVGVSCAGGGANTLRDRSEPCPAGAREAMEELESGRDLWEGLWLKEAQRFQLEVREGPIQGIVHHSGIGALPSGTKVKGRAVFEPGYTRLLFTEATLPDGKVYPICMEYFDKYLAQYGHATNTKGYGRDTATTRWIPNQLDGVLGVKRLNVYYEPRY